MKRVSVVFAAFVWLTSGLIFEGDAATVPSSIAACTAYVARVEALDAAGTRYALALQSQASASTIEGSLAIFASGDRYDVPFSGVNVADVADRSTIPTPVVVQFPGAVHLDGAVIAAFGAGPAAQQCAPLFSPWAGGDNDATRIGTMVVGTTRGPAAFTPYDAAATAARWAAFRSQASGVAAVPSGAATAVGVPACAQPYRVATTRHASKPELSPDTLMRMPSGSVLVRVSLDQGSAVTGVQLMRSSGDRFLDRAAIDAAKRSEFQAPVFRCEPVAGAFVFVVSFGS